MKLRDFLELARVSNLPTVWSNVAMGLAWGAAISRRESVENGYIVLRDFIELGSLLSSAFGMLVAGSMIYCAGMILNDAFDASIDKRERPNRPIPSGRVSRQRAFIIGFAMLLGSLVFLMQYRSPWVLSSACVLIGLVVFYNAIHSRFAGSIIVMAACRAVLVFLAVMSVNAVPITFADVKLIPPAAILLYTLLLSAIARHEVSAGRAWVVGVMIAAMPLVDVALLVSIGEWFVIPFCLMCAVLTWVGQRWIAGS